MSNPPTLEPIASSQLSTLSNLFELYAYEFSTIAAIEVGEDGRFGHDVGIWLREGDREAYFIRVDGKLAGFVLLHRGSRLRDDAAVMDVGEFFVLSYLRRRSIGKQVARAVFALYPGRWEVRVRSQNERAFAFWSDVVNDVAGGRQRLEERLDNQISRKVFHFDNGLGAG